MFKINFFIIISMIAFLMSCDIKTDKSGDEGVCIQQKPNYVIDEGLSSKDYSNFNGYFPKDGLVPTADIAFQIAEPILNKIYGREKIENEKPFSINLENDIWIIEGHLNRDLLGGVAYMEIQKSDGRILKVIHTK